jgi:hypothetical protein
MAKSAQWVATVVLMGVTLTGGTGFGEETVERMARAANANGSEAPAASRITGTNTVEKPEGVLARAAWQMAAGIQSPIDAGRETIGVARRFAAAGRTDYLQDAGRLQHLPPAQREAWIRSGVLAYQACAVATSGDQRRAKDLLAQAQREAGATIEWRRPLVEQPLANGEAAVMLEGAWRAQGLAVATNAMMQWMALEPGRRMGAVAWACAWKARYLADAKLSPELVAVAMRVASSLPAWEQLEIMACLSPINTQAVTRAEARASIESFTQRGDRDATNQVCDQASAGTTTNDTRRKNAKVVISSVPVFDSLVHMAEVCWGCGDTARAVSLLAEARARVEAGQEEDRPGAWRVLAQGYQRMGETAQAKAALCQSLTTGDTQPGFNREIALTRTLAMMAVSGLLWTEADVAAALKAAKVEGYR